MNKCIKITFVADFPEGFLQSFVQKQAKKLDLEGIVQIVGPGKKVRTVACGIKDKVDMFLDLIHKELAKYDIEEIEVEPFLKDKDYRNVFRVLE